MLEKPDIPDELIISCLQAEYGFHASALTFLPLGADTGSVSYRIVASDGTAYFLKLRKGFSEISVTVPLFLKSQGVKEIIAPFETKSKQGWADFGEYKMILYPFIEGKDGFEMELSDRHKQTLGAALKAIHSIKPPPTLKEQIPQETLSPIFREKMRSLQKQANSQVFHDPWAEELAKFMRSKQAEISQLIERADQLAAEIRSQPLEFILCHTDIHGGNMLFSDTGEFYIVDWDNPLLTPKERDLMFIGGGIDEIWKTKRDSDLFYEGYGNTKIDPALLAYYRYERVIEDLVAYGEQLLLTEEGGTDREEAYRRFTGNFEPGETIAIAERTNSSNV